MTIANSFLYAMSNSESHFPNPADLSRLSAEIRTLIEKYKKSESTSEKNDTLRQISINSRRLSNAATDPRDGFLDFAFQPLGNACVRAAISLGLFDQLSEPAGQTSAELANQVDAEHDVVHRILRALAALDLVQVDDEGRYLHSKTSILFTYKYQRAYSVWMWDVMAQASGSLGAYFEQDSSEEERTECGYSAVCVCA